VPSLVRNLKRRMCLAYPPYQFACVDDLEQVVTHMTNDFPGLEGQAARAEMATCAISVAREMHIAPLHHDNRGLVVTHAAIACQLLH